MPSRNDGPTAQDIERQLVDRIDAVVSDLYPGALVRGPVAYCSSKGGKDLGSFHVYLRDSGKFRRGSWNRWSEGIGGGVLNLIAYALTGSHKGTIPYREAFEWARRFLGIEDRQEGPAEKQARLGAGAQAEKKRDEEQAKTDQKREARALTAGEQWKGSIPVCGTIAEKYLLKRGLPLDLIRSINQGSIRFHPGIKYDKPPFTSHPCLLGRVVDVAGQGRALGRVFLTSGGDKADLEDPKLSIGSMSGGVVRLGGMSRRIGIAEGMETALAVMAINGGLLPVWATLGTSGMIGWECPVGVDEVIIFCDGDRPRERNSRIIQPGLDAAKRLQARLEACGVKCSIIEPPMGQDFLDLWNATKGHFNAA